MRPLAFLMKVQCEELPVRSDADGDFQGLNGVIFRPSFQRVQMFHKAHAVHFQEGDHGRKAERLLLQPELCGLQT